MKNVTVSIDDDLHRKARIRAAELGTSLSALVKQYLESLADAPLSGSAPAGPAGVRDMHGQYRHAPADPAKVDGPPWLVDGKWVYTRDGKPRQPGAMRGMWVADDFAETPQWLIDAFEGNNTEFPWPGADKPE